VLLGSWSMANYICFVAVAVAVVIIVVVLTLAEGCG